MTTALQESAESIPAELRGKATVDVPTAAKVLGIGRDAAYNAVRSGQIISLHFGARLRIPVAPLLRMIGVAPPGSGETYPASGGSTSAETVIQSLPIAGGASN